MESASKRSKCKGQVELFEAGHLGRKPRKAKSTLEIEKLPASVRSAPPIQTNSKSQVIAEYLANFQKVTKGGLYIDGFAAPQSRSHEEAWTARRVLEVSPPRLRVFWLCDIDPKGLLQLRRLKERHHNPQNQRRVFVMEGDFNKTVKIILKSHRLTRRAAIFALLDQRNTECHWATLQALSNRAGRHKIELMYFFGTSWIHRSLRTSSTPKRIAEITRWWGGEGWHDLFDLSQTQIAQTMADRFANELDYHYVNYYPVFQDEKGKKAAFYLIHASDHPEAPKLMARAYLKIIGDIARSPTDSQSEMF